MKPEDAAKKLSFHLMQCGALMPMDWIRENGEGSELQQAFRMALDALRDGERLRTELEAAVEDVLDAAITPCSYCKHGPINGGFCDMDNDNHEMFSCWEWRGPEEGSPEPERGILGDCRHL